MKQTIHFCNSQKHKLFFLIDHLWSLPDCIAGMYGAVCEKKCSQFCLNDNCKKTTGFCLNGCKSGYLGDICNQSKGSYTYLFLSLSLFLSFYFFSFQSDVIKIDSQFVDVFICPITHLNFSMQYREIWNELQSNMWTLF